MYSDVHSHEQTGDEKLWPCLADSASNGSQDTEDSRDEDSSTATKVEVAGVRQPASKESRSDIRSGIDNTDQPTVTNLVRSAIGLTLTDAELNWEAQVRTVATSLIPTLDRSTDGADDDGKVQCEWVLPSVSSLETERIFLVFCKDVQLLEATGVLSDESTTLNKLSVLDQVFVIGKLLNIVEQLLAGETSQGVGDPVLVSSCLRGPRRPPLTFPRGSCSS